MAQYSALDYDLMTMTGRTLREYLGEGAAGMVALSHFVAHVPPGSSLWRDLRGHHDYAGWDSPLYTNRILTDVYNALAGINHNYVKAHTKKGKSVGEPEPYPAPWAKSKKKRLGKDPIKAGKFRDWWNSKKKK